MYVRIYLTRKEEEKSQELVVLLGVPEKVSI